MAIFSLKRANLTSHYWGTNKSVSVYFHFNIFHQLDRQNTCLFNTEQCGVLYLILFAGEKHTAAAAGNILTAQMETIKPKQWAKRESKLQLCIIAGNKFRLTMLVA